MKAEKDVISGQMTIFDFLTQDTWSGKTSTEHSAPIKAKISESSLKKSVKSQIPMPMFLDLRGNGNHADLSWEKTIRGDGYSESEIMYMLNSTENHAVAVENHPNDSRVKISEDGVVQTLSGRMGTGGGNVPMVMEDKEYIVLENHPQDSRMKIKEDGIFQTMGARQGAKGNPHTLMVMESSAWDGGQVSPTLTANNVGGSQRMLDKDNFNAVISFGNGQLHDAISPSVEISKTLNCMVDPAKIVAYGLDRASYNQGMNAQFDFQIDEEKIGTQVSKGLGAVCTSEVRYNAVVRRLTPLECERLQGFPDNWTDIGEWVDSKGKKRKNADAPRYKALGNSIAIPFWQELAGRIAKELSVDNLKMGSLFDGIGGFPLAFSRYGVKPVWASEIEEFPIAVTKIRFKEDVK